MSQMIKWLNDLQYIIDSLSFSRADYSSAYKVIIIIISERLVVLDMDTSQENLN